MQFRGGLVNGVLGVVYGAAAFWCLYYTGAQHSAMQTTCYALGIVGILLAAYWLATKEVMGIPILLVGLVHFLLGAKADHMGMQTGCVGLGVMTFVVGLLMLATLRKTT